jgi:hypothetical protein
VAVTVFAVAVNDARFAFAATTIEAGVESGPVVPRPIVVALGAAPDNTTTQVEIAAEASAFGLHERVDTPSTL